MMVAGRKGHISASTEVMYHSLTALHKNHLQGCPWGYSDYESACQCRRHGFSPCWGKIPHNSEQLSPGSSTTEALVYNDWGLRALEPALWMGEAATVRSSRRYSEKLTRCESSPAHCSLSQPAHSDEDPAQPKLINRYIFENYLRT